MTTAIHATASSFFDQTVSLDGTIYRITQRWNNREEAWYIDIDEQDGTPIVRGQKIVPLVNLTSRFADERLPPGVLIVDSSQPKVRPDRDSLEDKAMQVTYAAEEELGT